MDKKIAVIDPGGHILFNPNLLGIVEILCEKVCPVDIYCRKLDIPQYLSGYPVRFTFYNKFETILKKLRVFRVPMALIGIVKIIDKSLFFRIVGDYDLIIGVDREGVVLASEYAIREQIPYTLISYEIAFKRETSPHYKKYEIKASQGIEFAVCQDPLRSGKLSVENMIPPDKIINIPVAGRKAQRGPKTFFLHDKLGIGHDKHIALFMGNSERWSKVEVLAEYSRDWQDCWVLVVHFSFGITGLRDRLIREMVEKYKNSQKVYFSPMPVDSCKDLTPIIKSADLGIALYYPTYDNPYTGDNLRYLGLSSGKISTYLQHGLPVVVNEIGTWSDVIKSEKLGFVENGKFGLPSPGSLYEYKERCYEYFENMLDLDKTAKPFLNKVIGLISR